jgi:CRP-like cAMP-binding protein
MVEEAIKKHLAEHPVFKGLDEKHISAITQHAKKIHVNEGVLIFNQDTPADAFYIVLEGEVSVEIPAIYGSPINMQTLAPGDVLGWSWLFPPYKWHFDARATEDTTLVEVDGKSIREECEVDTRMGYELVLHFAAFMQQRMEAARRRVMDLYGPDS